LTRYFVAVTAPAERDLRDIFQWSETEFGIAAADRYEILIEQALADIGENPYLPGANHRRKLVSGVYTYHLASSRDRVPENRVKAPRHFLVYRVITDRIEILRVLHDSRDLDRHIPRDQSRLVQGLSSSGTVFPCLDRFEGENSTLPATSRK
jgi:toxin ParE1/3/4